MVKGILAKKIVITCVIVGFKEIPNAVIGEAKIGVTFKIE